jgi:sterol desaturase/sphingolipid hydroxylase (fatty acid hydroxylase superfamily)
MTNNLRELFERSQPQAPVEAPNSTEYFVPKMAKDLAETTTMNDRILSVVLVVIFVSILMPLGANFGMEKGGQIAGVISALLGVITAVLIKDFIIWVKG